MSRQHYLGFDIGEVGGPGFRAWRSDRVRPEDLDAHGRLCNADDPAEYHLVHFPDADSARAAIVRYHARLEAEPEPEPEPEPGRVVSLAMTVTLEDLAESGTSLDRLVALAPRGTLITLEVS